MTQDDRCVTVRRIGDRNGGVQVRGQPYGVRAAPGDPMHQFLDACDPATVSAVMTYDAVTVNPRNPRSAPTVAACDNLYKENP